MARTLAQTFRFHFDERADDVLASLDISSEIRLEGIPLTRPEADRIGRLIEQAVELLCEAEERRRLPRPSHLRIHKPEDS